MSHLSTNLFLFCIIVLLISLHQFHHLILRLIKNIILASILNTFYLFFFYFYFFCNIFHIFCLVFIIIVLPILFHLFLRLIQIIFITSPSLYSSHSSHASLASSTSSHPHLCIHLFFSHSVPPSTSSHSKHLQLLILYSSFSSHLTTSPTSSLPKHLHLILILVFISLFSLSSSINFVSSKASSSRLHLCFHAFVYILACCPLSAVGTPALSSRRTLDRRP